MLVKVYSIKTLFICKEWRNYSHIYHGWLLQTQVQRVKRSWRKACTVHLCSRDIKTQGQLMQHFCMVATKTEQRTQMHVEHDKEVNDDDQGCRWDCIGLNLQTLAMKRYCCAGVLDQVCLYSGPDLRVLPCWACFRLLVLSHLPGNVTCPCPAHTDMFFHVPLIQLIPWGPLPPFPQITLCPPLVSLGSLLSFEVFSLGVYYFRWGLY